MFGRHLKRALAREDPATAHIHSVELMPVIFPGSRLSARIERRDDGVFVRFQLADQVTRAPGGGRMVRLARGLEAGVMAFLTSGALLPLVLAGAA